MSTPQFHTDPSVQHKGSTFSAPKIPQFKTKALSSTLKNPQFLPKPLSSTPKNFSVQGVCGTEGRVELRGFGVGLRSMLN